MNRTHYIYQITFPNGKKYIGQTLDYKQRFREHKHYANNKPTQVVHFALNKYGISNCLFEVIDFASNQYQANCLEEGWIERLNTMINNHQGYNLAKGGNTVSGEDHHWFGKHHTDDSKKAISNAQIKINLDPKVIEQKRLAFTGNTLGSLRRGEKRQPHSEETKKKISENNGRVWLGKKRDPETVAKITASNTGKKRTPEQIINMKKSHPSRFSKEQIDAIKIDPRTQKIISEEYKCSQTFISYIKSGKRSN